MIARWLRALKRALLKAEIADMEKDIEAIDKQRANDDDAKWLIGLQLTVARRQLQAMNQAEINLTMEK